jgi:hypothetical protein
LSLDELRKLVGEKDKAEGIYKMIDVVGDYAQFKTILELGLQVNQADIPFEKVMMFSWIKEAIENGRKN